MRNLFFIKKAYETKVLKLFALSSILFGVCVIAVFYILNYSPAQKPLLEPGFVQDVNLLAARQSFVFIENRGQWNERANFVARQVGMTAWFERDGITLQLEKQDAQDQRNGVVTRLTFMNVSEMVQLRGENSRKTKYNYLIGKNNRKWQSNVSGYEYIVYDKLYDGIDLRVRNNNGVLEYDLMLQPLADLEQIVVECEGIQGLKIDENGSLIIETAIDPIRQKMPKTWHVLADGEQLPVLCEYRLLDETHYGFVVENRRPELALVIDPGLEWSTFVGGTGNEQPGFSNGLAIADNGDILLCGRTTSLDFPTTTGAYDTSLASDYEVFVSRWNPDLSGSDQLIWSTFIGDSSFEQCNAIQVDDLGTITIAGETSSENFPTTANAYDTTYNGGGSDAFIAQLDASGSNLLYSTFVGGSRGDLFQDLTVDPANNIIVTGSTSSSDFPVSLDAFDSEYNGGGDVVVTKLDPNQSGENQLIMSTYLGGDRYEEATALDINAAGDVIVSGIVESRDFPTTAGAFAESHNGGTWDIFIARIDPGQSASTPLLYATYLGGVGDDYINTMVIDQAGVVTISGDTRSENFPLTNGAYDRSFASYHGLYISQLDFNLSGESQLIYSTFISGGSVEIGRALAVDESGVIYLAGTVLSSGFPTTSNAYDQTFNGYLDGFVLRLNPNNIGANQIEYSTYIGGYTRDFPINLALDASGNMIIAGYTRSSDFPITQNAYSQTFAGGREDAFLARVGIGPIIPLAKTLYSKLDGDQEYEPVATSGTGNGVFELNEDSTSLDYEISVSNLTGSITGAHFHTAPMDSNGPVVKTLFTGGTINGDTTFSGMWTSGDAEPLSTTLLTALCADEIYVNVHTNSFPAGEIRGQVVTDTLATVARAVAGVFYGTLGKSAGDNIGSLISIDPANGAGSLIGPTGITSAWGDGVPAVASTSKGELFATNMAWSPLYRLDAQSGGAIVVGETGQPTPDAMASDMNDVLYAKLFDGQFYTFDKQTGAATWLGNIGVYIRGMAFDPTDNTLWASAGGGADGYEGPVDAIYTIDITTAEATFVGKTGFGGSIPGLAFDEDGNLFGVVGGGKRPNDLISIDKTTGVGTIVGPVGFPSVSALARRIAVPAGPQISVDAQAINVGNAEIGRSASRTITINNYGAEDLTVSAITDPSAPFIFADLPDFPVVIPQRKSETFRITFSPLSTGRAQTTLSISSNDSDDPIFEREIFGHGVDFGRLAEFGKVYASTGPEDGGRLISLNSETGEGTLVGSIGLPGVPGLAASTLGQLFATTGWAVNPNLYQLDATSGAEITVGSMGIQLAGIEAIAFDGNDVLYGHKNPSSLLQINTETGATYEIVSISDLITGMAFDPTDGILWISSGQSDAISTVDLATGEVTQIGLTGFGGSTSDIYFDEAGNLYGITAGDGGASDTLISIDKTSGAGTLIGEIGFSNVSGATARLNRAIVGGIKDQQSFLPKVFVLAQNYPNPFNPSTTIRYDLPKSVHVKLAIYDILGRRIRTLADDYQIVGRRQVIWDGRNDNGMRVATGMYLYRMEAEDFSKARKLLLIK